MTGQTRNNSARTKPFLRFAYEALEEKYAKGNLSLRDSDWRMLVALLRCCVNDSEQTPESFCRGLTAISKIVSDAYTAWERIT